MKKSIIYILILLTCFMLMETNTDVIAAESSYALSYHVGAYSFQMDTSGNVYATID